MRVSYCQVWLVQHLTPPALALKLLHEPLSIQLFSPSFGLLMASDCIAAGGYSASCMQSGHEHNLML